jgi:hypothetical protein
VIETVPAPTIVPAKRHARPEQDGAEEISRLTPEIIEARVAIGAPRERAGKITSTAMAGAGALAGNSIPAGLKIAGDSW